MIIIQSSQSYSPVRVLCARLPKRQRITVCDAPKEKESERARERIADECPMSGVASRTVLLPGRADAAGTAMYAQLMANLAGIASALSRSSAHSISCFRSRSLICSGHGAENNLRIDEIRG